MGRVAKLGLGAEATGIKVGDRVGIKWISSACGRCTPCLARHDGVCVNQRISGYFTPGTFQQYALGPAHYVTPIPAGLDSAAAAPLLCAGVTCYSALLKSGAAPGEWVVVSGAGGGLGHLACQIASRALGYRVVGLDSGGKRDIAMDSGAEHFVDFGAFASDAELAAHVKSLTGEEGLGAHAVVVCTAANRAYAQAVEMLRFNGTVVCVGIPEGELLPIATASPSRIAVQQLRIVGSAVGNQKEAIEVLDFAARGVIRSHFQIRKSGELTKVFEEMNAGTLQGRVVLDLA